MVERHQDMPGSNGLVAMLKVLQQAEAAKVDESNASVPDCPLYREF